MANSEIKSEKIKFVDIFSSKFWFVVPEYQRSYVWGTDNITELFEDLKYASENKPESEYFLGSLVLKNLSNGKYPEYEVLDGQQRLTTFFMMMAVIRDIISGDDEKETMQETIYQKGNKLKRIPSRTRITYKIRDKVDDFISAFLINENGTKSCELENYKKSDNISISNMTNAILVLRSLLEPLKKEIDDFTEFVFNKAVFIYVSTENTEDAFRMFTILNNRGIPLTNADILKSENIGVLKVEKEITKYAEIWEEIEAKHNDGFDRFLQFIRTILVKEKARSNLLDEFHDKIYKSVSPNKPKLDRGVATFKLIELYNEIYEKIIELESNSIDNEFKNLVTIMRIGFRSEDWIPPLLQYYHKFGLNRLNDFLHCLEYKFCGDWVCGITPTSRLDAMNNIIKAIDEKNLCDEVIEEDGLYEVNKTDYRANLNSDIFNKQYSKYLLLKVEYLLWDNTAFVADYKHLSVEHVLPQNPKPDSTWVKVFTSKQREEWTHKLANLVLISKIKNSKLSNLDFLEKKSRYLDNRIDVFKNSKIFMDSQAEWTPEILESRQKYLVNLLLRKK